MQYVFWKTLHEKKAEQHFLPSPSWFLSICYLTANGKALILLFTILKNSPISFSLSVTPSCLLLDVIGKDFVDGVIK